MKRVFQIGRALASAGIDGATVVGDPEAGFSSPSTLQDAREGQIAFCSAVRIPDPVEAINASRASVIVTDAGIRHDLLRTGSRAIVLVHDPRAAFIRILGTHLAPEKPGPGIHPTAVVDPGAAIHPSAHIGAYCVIGAAAVGEGSVIRPNVVINDRVTIGSNVEVNPGCVIGFDGFAYARNQEGELEKFGHYGGVVIEDDVEIGSNTSVDRGTLGDTVIRRGAKIDNFCHIAHNVVVGRNSMVIAHAMIGGSTIIGDEAWVAPNASLRDGLKIGDRSLVGLGAVVTRDVPDGAVVAGNPAREFEKKQPPPTPAGGQNRMQGNQEES